MKNDMTNFEKKTQTAPSWIKKFLTFGKWFLLFPTLLGKSVKAKISGVATTVGNPTVAKAFIYTADGIWGLAIIVQVAWVVVVVISAVAVVKPAPSPSSIEQLGLTPQSATTTVEASQQTQQAESKKQEALKITFVVDGDTVELSTGQRVRLIGIDSPERGSPYYSEARDKLMQLVLNKEVRLENDITETDRYGRLLRYIYVGQTFINLEMVNLGYATSYTYPPDVKYQDQIVKAEQYARNAKLGLWTISSTPSPTPSATSTSPPPTSTPQPEPTTSPTPPPSTTYSVPPCASSDCDCGHFSTHDHAQWFHDNYDPTDKHRLDQDKDGLACESLP